MFFFTQKSHRQNLPTHHRYKSQAPTEENRRLGKKPNQPAKHTTHQLTRRIPPFCHDPVSSPWPLNTIPELSHYHSTFFSLASRSRSDSKKKRTKETQHVRTQHTPHFSPSLLFHHRQRWPCPLYDHFTFPSQNMVSQRQQTNKKQTEETKK